MNTFIIGYDLIKPDKDYPKLIEAICENFPTYWHNLDSTWIIKTDSNSQAIGNFLLKYMDSNDRLFVGELGEDAAWKGFEQTESDWLKKNI